jgi:hypothetical protein
MSEDVQRLVDERWSEYGLGEDTAVGPNGRNRSLRQLLRR